MKTCACSDAHEPRHVVLTGGPGGGKTAILEIIRQSFCRHVKILPEAAGIVFGGGFPRGESDRLRQAAQRAIFYVQRELEAAADSEDPAVVLCDRGTIDGAAYWPSQDDLWSSVGTTFEEQLKRYDAVIHLRTPTSDDGYNYTNPLRIESATAAADIDARIARLWEAHPRRFIVEAASDFITKAARAIEILRAEVPECCRTHPIPFLGEGRAGGSKDETVGNFCG